MRLIDADALFKQIQHAEIEAPDLVCKAWVMADVASMIHNSPTIYAEPVRHGRWIEIDEGEGGHLMECSVCMEWLFHNFDYISNYCPNCGAKMDAEVIND